LESQYHSKKDAKLNEIEEMLLSLVMENNDETLKMEYESNRVINIEEQQMNPIRILNTSDR
jgi:hypothetical protein